ncbi:HAMP domain-containing protein [Bdellovibrionota bacterium FG-2]
MMKWLSNLPLSKKLNSIIIMFLVGTLAMAGLSTLGMKVLSGTRAFVGAEGQWAKAQKEAVYSLYSYVSTHDERWYRRFQEFLKVPNGMEVFRVEMEKPDPDMKVALNGLIAGHNAPEDFDDMANLFRRFRGFGHIDKAIHIWADADLAIDELESLSGRLYTHHVTHKSHLDAEDQKEEALLSSQIHTVNDRLIEHENNFSRTLGEASRWAKGVLLAGILLCMALVAAFGFLFLRLIIKDLTHRTRILVQGMEAVAKGEHNLRCDDSAKDEIGVAAASFNKMTAKLQETTVYLVQSEKLNALGELTASISHELKNP